LSCKRPLLRPLPCAGLLALAALFFGLTQEVESADLQYQLGHGLDIGPFNFAGYSDVVLNVPAARGKALVLNDLSLFVAGHITPLINPFVESELSGLDLARFGHPGPAGNDTYFSLERLYNDSYLSDSLTLRLGKMLAPVGEWNQIHAPPLVLATVRPAVTFRNFSEYISGISVLYSDAEADFPDLQIYEQPSDEFSARAKGDGTNTYKMVQGGHLNFPLSLLDKIGFSFQSGKLNDGNDQMLWGVDWHYSLDSITLEGEWTISRFSHVENGALRHLEWGGYLAASYTLSDTWSLYAWHEEFSDRSERAAARDLLFGISFRPHPALVGKIEYLQNIGDWDVNPTGLFASWSILF
jgi:hypothetical protein